MSIDDDQQLTRAKAQSQSSTETRDHVTPFAFKVAKELLGTPLASPFRRAMSLLVDLLLVAMLSGVSGNVLAVIIAILLWRSGRRLAKNQRTTRASWGLKSLAGLLLLLGTIGMFSQPLVSNFINLSDQSDEDGVIINDRSMALKTLVFSGQYLVQINAIEQQVASGECESVVVCWQRLAQDFVDDLQEFDATDAVKQELFDQFLLLSAEQLSTDQVGQLTAQTQSRLLSAAANAVENKQSIAAGDSDILPEQTADLLNSNQPSKPGAADVDISDSVEPAYSLIGWIKGIASDLGLGFGWAAAYFTATMVWLNGQTIGKRLLGIKVVKLDGSLLNVWESFGRYGGYGAGLATGLLGFVQIFWDPNRQAIQDKISETLVIRLSDTNKKWSDHSANE